jgi:tetratricopeptide (TPR) repeat protein
LEILFFALLYHGVFTLDAAAQDPAATFEAANKLYEQGNYSDAAALYEKLTARGQSSPVLLFNLGNACFKSGQVGKAIAAYRQAEQLNPRDPDIRANLQFARNQIQGPTIAPSATQRWLTTLTLNEWTVLAASAAWLFFLVLGLLQWRPALKRPLRVPVILLALATIFLGCCLAADYSQTRLTRTAIVTARDAVVRHGPLDESQTAFTVHDGAELLVLDRKDDWLQVSIDPRRIGWVRRDQVLFPIRS